MLWVDHRTKPVYPYFQETKSCKEACQSKRDYETFAKRYNVDIDKGHTNNCAFRTVIFQKEIEAKGQNISVSRVNLQWKNGLIERSNGTLCATARSMLNHAISNWDNIITPDLWTYAIQQAATIFNNTKRRSSDYEEIIWEQSTGERQKLDQSDMHPLVCPVYILNRCLQKGGSHPKWYRQAKHKIYVGHLHHYSLSVPLIWDSITKLVSPHFHVIFDDNFQTVQPPNMDIKMAETMDRLFKTNN
jgi:hypothetical protein